MRAWAVLAIGLCGCAATNQAAAPSASMTPPSATPSAPAPPSAPATPTATATPAPTQPRSGFLQEHGVLLTQAEIDSSGTRRYHDRMTDIYWSAIGALKYMHYDIESQTQNAAEGLIVTKRKATAIAGRTRQYTIELHAQDGGWIQVIARPHLFDGDVEISEQPVWQLDGDGGERAAWNVLLHGISELE